MICIQTESYTTYCSSNRQEQTSMIWPFYEERGRVNDEGLGGDESNDEGNETKRNTKTKVARQHR